MKNIIIYILTALVFTGCDLLQTRDAETPNQPRSNYEQAVTPQQLLSNLVNSLKDKDVQNYINCLIDSSFSNKKFVFSPSSGAQSQYPFLTNDWNIRDEDQYFKNLITRVSDQSPITLSLTNELYSPQGDSLIYTATYSINVPGNDPGLKDYQGDLRFNMVRDSRSIWVIYYWQDTKSTALPSWSELKGQFY
ncbi:MAG TPA: hypothetical protein VI230_02815 [Ignavibacteriaceae bacterium]